MTQNSFKRKLNIISLQTVKIRFFFPVLSHSWTNNLEGKEIHFCWATYINPFQDWNSVERLVQRKWILWNRGNFSVLKQMHVIGDYCLSGMESIGPVIIVSKHRTEQRLLRSLKSTHKFLHSLWIAKQPIEVQSSHKWNGKAREYASFHC